MRVALPTGPSGRRRFIVSLFAFVALFAAGCRQTPVAPVDIAEGDACAACKSTIYERQYAAQFITKDGFARKFDDISCMVQFSKKVGANNIAAYYVADYATGEWLPAGEASFVRSSAIKTPMNSGILALKDKAGAEAIAREYQADLLSFADLEK